MVKGTLGGLDSKNSESVVSGGLAGGSSDISAALFLEAIEICQKHRVSLTNYGFSWEAIGKPSRVDEFHADRLWWLRSGSRRGMGRSGFEPLKA
jgi:hypothetical protein